MYTQCSALWTCCTLFSLLTWHEVSVTTGWEWIPSFKIISSSWPTMIQSGRAESLKWYPKIFILFSRSNFLRMLTSSPLTYCQAMLSTSWTSRTSRVFRIIPLIQMTLTRKLNADKHFVLSQGIRSRLLVCLDALVERLQLQSFYYCTHVDKEASLRSRQVVGRMVPRCTLKDCYWSSFFSCGFVKEENGTSEHGWLKRTGRGINDCKRRSKEWKRRGMETRSLEGNRSWDDCSARWRRLVAGMQPGEPSAWCSAVC